MDSFNIISGQSITSKHIAQAVQLDAITYKEEYCLDFLTCCEFCNINPYLYFAAVTADDKMLGYLSFVPISYTAFAKIKTGKIFDTIIQKEDITAYQSSRGTYIKKAGV